MTKNNIDIQEALLDPTKFFSHPQELLDNKGLSRDQKIKILERWEYDAKELEIADDENMAENTEGSDILDEILQALDRLRSG